MEEWNANGNAIPESEQVRGNRERVLRREGRQNQGHSGATEEGEEDKGRESEAHSGCSEETALFLQVPKTGPSS